VREWGARSERKRGVISLVCLQSRRLIHGLAHTSSRRLHKGARVTLTSSLSAVVKAIRVTCTFLVVCILILLMRSFTLHPPAQAKNEVQGRLLLNVVVGEGAAILKLLPSKDQALLVWGDALLVLNLGLDTLDSVRGLHVQGDGLPRKSLHEDLHRGSGAWGRKDLICCAEMKTGNHERHQLKCLKWVSSGHAWKKIVNEVCVCRYK
jgi:hypothetical protein